MATAESISIQGLNFVCVDFFAFPGCANWLYFIFSHDLLQTVLPALYKSYALLRSSGACYFNFEKPLAKSPLFLGSQLDSIAAPQAQLLAGDISQLLSGLEPLLLNFSVHLSLLPPLF